MVKVLILLLVLIPMCLAVRPAGRPVGPPAHASQSSGTHCETDEDCPSGLFGYSCLPPSGSASSSADSPSSSSQYKCQLVPVPPMEYNAIVCEGDAMYLTCPDGKTLLILSAIYGRSEPGTSVCPHNSIQTTSCSSATSDGIVQTECDGQQRCFIEANNGLYGDPCPGTFKYLEVTYICQ